MMILKHIKRSVVAVLGFILIVSMIVSITACSAFISKVKAEDLMEGVKPKAVDGKPIDDKFISNTADFSIELFKKSIAEKENSLISPISVMLALAMTANGAANETLSQMEEVLGKDIPLEELNEYLYYYVNNLPSEEKSKLNIANSIWFRDDEDRLTVEKDFLQKNADYYNAAIYKSPFDDQTLQDINNWVKTNTDGMIDKILEKIDDDSIMYLINAIVFDAEWKTVYNKSDIHEGEFTTIDGSKQTVEFMNSEESIYLDDGSATGFIKPYYNDKYSFVALLPNEGISIKDYIETLSGEGFLNTVKSAQNTVVNAVMPKFSYDYKIKLNDALKDLGMHDGLSAAKADFSRLGKSSRGNIYIGEVLHKTFISVDELGTKAGAVTKVEMKYESAPAELKIVRLDRPFVYAIIDNSTNLPVFIGTVMNPKE